MIDLDELMRLHGLRHGRAAPPHQAALLLLDRTIVTTYSDIVLVVRSKTI